MNHDEARAWLAEFWRRRGLTAGPQAAKLGSIAERVRAWRFPAQQAFADDPARRKLARKGRRAGGSENLATILLEKADIFKGSVVPYVTLTKGTARRILWPKLKRLDRTLGLGLRFNETELRATLPNESAVWLTGADKANEIEKIRGGDQGHPLIAIDEVQAFGPFLRDLVEDVSDAAVAEFDGQILMCGTPNASCAGYFFDADNSANGVSGWSSHHWTLLDNPFFRAGAGQAFLDQKLKERGWTEETPAFRREYLGLWHRSDEDLCYGGFLETRNCYGGDLPVGIDWYHVMGIDVGFDDSFALKTWAYSAMHPKAYERDFFSARGMTVTQMANVVNEVRARAHLRRKLTAIVVDQGGLGKAIAEDWRQHHNIPCEPAKKSEKRSYIQMMSGDFRMDLIKVLRSDRPYINQLSQLQWAEDGVHEDPRMPNDDCDGGLYGWRKARNWMYRAPAKVPEPGTPEAIEAESARMREIVVERQKESHRKPAAAKTFAHKRR